MGLRTAAACLVLAGLVLPDVGAASGGASPRSLADSVRLPDPGGLSIGRARIVRTALTPGELAAPMAISVSLRMRGLDELRGRVAAGERVGEAEMEARYRPLRADFDRVAAWLSAQGFARTLEDRTHTSVFIRGSAADVARVFGTRFARVAVDDGEYTSAVSAPAIPGELAAAVLSVGGLQPQFRLRHIQAAFAPAPRDLVGSLVYVTPDNLAAAYNFPAGLTGAGQIIAIVGEAPVANSDLSTFWRTSGVAQSAANVTTIDVAGGAGNSPDEGLVQEADLDVEWVGAMAPGAGIRFYLADNVFACLTVVLGDAPAFPQMTVLSISFAATEGEEGDAVLETYSQVFAQLAASGLSVMVGSGDSGSNPTPLKGAGFYSASEPLAVTYPASDPSVTGVGGTAIDFDGDWNYSGETVWNDIANTMSATGGGISSFFPKPAWQAGGALLASQTMRCVPDVAAMSVADLQNVVVPGFEPYTANGVGVVIYENGEPKYASGTSLACPVWAATAAIINQSRAQAGKGPIGLLNPHLYPLSGTGAFNDVTTGNNGAYAAGPGYDLSSGLGSPDVGNLVAALGSTPNGSSPRLVNVSTRAQVNTGSAIAIAGFVVQGASGTLKNVLVRGIGPALVPLGVGAALSQPKLDIYDAKGALIVSDAGWANGLVPGTSAAGAAFRLATAGDMSAAGAFALPSESPDCAVVLRLPPGAYTAQISGRNGGTGVALAEAYALDTAASEVLLNISTRCYVGTGSSVAISGFVIDGNGPAQLLLRGVGPGLAAFGLTQTLSQPMISIIDSSNTLIASNAGWGNPPVAGTSGVPASWRQATVADMQSVGAFALAAGSPDAALVATLPPGAYTVIVSGVGDSTGTGLVEVYQLTIDQ